MFQLRLCRTSWNPFFNFIIICEVGGGGGRTWTSGDNRNPLAPLLRRLAPLRFIRHGTKTRVAKAALERYTKAATSTQHLALKRPSTLSFYSSKARPILSRSR